MNSSLPDAQSPPTRSMSSWAGMFGNVKASQSIVSVNEFAIGDCEPPTMNETDATDREDAHVFKEGSN